MSQKSFDDLQVRSAMTAYLQAADALDEASRLGDEPRQLLELAETKSVASMALSRRLVDLGWSAPTSQRTTT